MSEITISKTKYNCAEINVFHFNVTKIFILLFRFFSQHNPRRRILLSKSFSYSKKYE